MIIASYQRDDRGNIYLDDGSGQIRLIKPRLAVPRPYQLLIHAFATGVKHGLMIIGAVSFLMLAQQTADRECAEALSAKPVTGTAIMLCGKPKGAR